MDFEQGVDLAQISSTIPGLEFTTTLGLQWAYADVRSGRYNVRPYGTQLYETNGNFFAWLGVTGDVGRITFVGGPATYLSALVSTNSGLTLDAFDSSGTMVATSGRADSNTGTQTFTRLTVEAPAIAYVEIHDTGNFWLMDDLCTDAPSPCQRVQGLGSGPPSDRIDLVFVPDADYAGNTATFDVDVLHQIQDRIGGNPPLAGHLDRFNFYFTRQQGDSHAGSAADPGAVCGPATLPNQLRTQCPFADAFVVLHTAPYGDCTSGGVFSAEGALAYGDNDRSFIHESGHGLFGLWDEYDDAPGCATGRGSTDSNTWTQLASCQTAATNNGGNSNQCYHFTTCAGGRWKLGDPSLASDADRYADPNFQYIMLDGTRFANGWGDASTWWINSVLGQLGAKPAMPSPVPSSEKSLIIDLTVADSGVTVNRHGFEVAAPPNFYQRSYPLSAFLYAGDGSLLGRFGFDDPRNFQAELGYPGPMRTTSASITLALPYFFNVAMGEIRDSAGNVLATVDLSQWATGPGPVANAGGPYATNEGTTITLDASASTGNIVLYEWDLNGDGKVEVESSNPIASYTPPDEYTGPAYVRVTASNGFSTVAATTISVANVAPTANAGPDLVGVVGEPVQMAGSFTDPSTVDTHDITWTWGDGSVSSHSTLTASHTYTKQGTYTVILRVTDDDGGVGQDTLVVKVLHNACVLAGSTVTFMDRVNVQAPFGAGFFSNEGIDSSVDGDAVVNGNAALGDRALLDGGMTLAGVVQKSPSATITKGLVEHSQDIQLPTLPRKTVPTRPINETIPNGANVTLAPGTHGNLTIRARATVTFAAGDHNFASLTIEPDVKIKTSGVVGLNVQGDFSLGDRSVIESTALNSPLLYTNGNVVRIGNGCKVRGLVAAPNATVTVWSRTQWTGCVGGKNVVFQPDASLTRDGFTLPRGM